MASERIGAAFEGVKLVQPTGLTSVTDDWEVVSQSSLLGPKGRSNEMQIKKEREQPLGGKKRTTSLNGGEVSTERQGKIFVEGKGKLNTNHASDCIILGPREGGGKGSKYIKRRRKVQCADHGLAPHRCLEGVKGGLSREKNGQIRGPMESQGFCVGRPGTYAVWQERRQAAGAKVKNLPISPQLFKKKKEGSKKGEDKRRETWAAAGGPKSQFRRGELRRMASRRVEMGLSLLKNRKKKGKHNII